MRTFTDVKKGSNLNIHETPTECPKISTFGYTKSYQYPKATNLKRNLRERPCPSCLDPRTMAGMEGLWRQDTHLQKRWGDQVSVITLIEKWQPLQQWGISIGYLSLLMEEQEEMLSVSVGEQAQATPYFCTQTRGRFCYPHESKALNPWHDCSCSHINNIHSLKTSSAFHTFTQGFLSSQGETQTRSSHLMKGSWTAHYFVCEFQ